MSQLNHTEPVRQLKVSRCLSDGQVVLVGTLAQDRQAVYFQYDADYLRQQPELSPFFLTFGPELQKAPASPHYGLHGVFADALPDGWGMRLMDSIFRCHGINPMQLSAMDRLAYVGASGTGALRFAPASTLSTQQQDSLSSVAELGLAAQRVFDGDAEEVLAELAQAGSSGGARPKALVYLNPETPNRVHTWCGAAANSDLQPWLVKFTSASLLLGHDEGLCEAAYLTMAANAGIAVPDWRLLPAPASSGAKAWLGMQRFDCLGAGGRLHMHSAAGLLDADFRLPSLDYLDLIKASNLLCKSPATGQRQFRRAVFNLFALNQDDHAKNWAFLQDDQGHWRESPFYDVTYSPSPFNEHSTAFQGHGQQPPLQVMQALAAQANFASWSDAKVVIEEVADALSVWPDLACELGVSKPVRVDIAKALEQQRQRLAYLCN